MTCGKRQHEGLELPSTGEVPQFVPLECSLLPKTRTVDGKEESYTYPEYIAPCDSCGWDKVAPTNCPVDMSDAQVTWTEKQEIGPNEESVYAPRTGTRRELLEAIRRDAPHFIYHQWLCQWQIHQINLDYQTFDPRTSINIVTDFSAIYNMKGAVQEKCSHGTSCNCCVSLVLYKPKREGQLHTSPIRCDVWRIWSAKKGNASFHQTAMKEIAQHYKTDPDLVPDLQLAKVKSDGQRSQYKGRKNLGIMAEWPHPPCELNTVDCFCKDGGSTTCGNFMEPGLSIGMEHDFYPSHHGSGAWDSYGKDAPKAMDRDTAFKKSTHRYDAYSCYNWCVKNMSKPSGNKEHRGIFAADGEYHWRAYAEKDDSSGHRVIDKERDFQALPGSNELYCWKATHKFAPVLEADFVSCFCVGCRDKTGCKYTKYTRAHVQDKTGPEEFVTHAKAPEPKRKKRKARDKKKAVASDTSDSDH